MKEPKQECAKPPKLPRPNMKNKAFVKWSRAETCKKEDNIVSTDWHETLKTTKPFEPDYDNAPLNMVYLLSGEYGRIWQKERDEWYSNVFVPKAREKDMLARRKKIRQQIREAKKAAEISIKERKERRVKELEAKAKAEAEKLERVRARVRKLAAGKSGKANKKKDTKSKSLSESDQNQGTCPKGWTPVELTLQCECSEHNKEKSESEKKEEGESESSVNQTPDQSCVMCEGYAQQLKEFQDAKSKEYETKPESSEENEKEKEKETGPQ